MLKIKSFQDFLRRKDLLEKEDPSQKIPSNDSFVLTLPGDLLYKYCWDGRGWWAKNIKTGKILDLKENAKAIKLLNAKFPQIIEKKSQTNLEIYVQKVEAEYKNLRRKYLQGITDLYIVHPSKKEIEKVEDYLSLLDNYSDRIFENPDKIKIFVSSSYDDTIKTIDDFIKNGVTGIKHLVIGSHGNGKTLLMTTGNNQENANEKFYHKIKKLLSPEGIVYFTACSGAKNLQILATASNIIGKKTYANTDTNFFGFGGKGVFYECNPTTEELQGLTNEVIIKKGICRECQKPPIWWVSKTDSLINELAILYSVLEKKSKQLAGEVQQNVQDMGNYIESTIESARKGIQTNMKAMSAWISGW
jgi:ABC-type uncharacterized transport system ATPase subunit